MILMSTTEGCGAELFPLPNNALRDLVLWMGEAVHPVVAASCGVVQGPQPARCTREHPNDPWHHDGHGTWWR
jgi:hypothetical protein